MIRMITKVINTDSLPVVGGSIGAVLSQWQFLFSGITADKIIATIFFATLVAIVGGVIGYLVKVLMDKIFRKG